MNNTQLKIVSPAVVMAVFVLLGSAPAALAIFGDEAHSGQPLQVKEIVIEGNTHTDICVILRELGFGVGDEFTYEIMDQAWDTLEDIGYFAFVDMDYEEDDEGQVVLRIMVEEDLTTGYGPRLRYSRRHKYELGGWLDVNNWRGKGETLHFDFSAIYLQRAKLAWQRPWLFGQEGLQADVSLNCLRGDFVFRPTRYRQRQADLQLKWNFYRSFFLTGGINYGQDDYRDSYTWQAPDRGDNTVEGSVYYGAEKQNRTALESAIGWDNRSNPWYPSQGVYVRAGLRHWTSAEFDSYTETNFDARLFLPVPVGKHILALRAFGRQVDGPAHLDNVLFYGGPETIRGYDFGQLEGEEGYLLTAEYRIPLFIMPISPQGEMVGLGLHFFADAGDAWFEGSEAGQALQSYGGGAHLNIDRMQLRFEGARTKDGHWRFEFMDTFNF